MASRGVLPKHWPLGLRLALAWHAATGWTHSHVPLRSGLIVHRFDKGPGRRRVYLTRDTTVDRGLGFADSRGTLRVSITGGTLDRLEAFRRDPHGTALPRDYRFDPAAGRVFHSLDGQTFSVRLDDIPEIIRIVRQ